jgi:hypothetical protein
MARLGNRLSRSVAPLIDEHLESRARPVAPPSSMMRISSAL